MKKYHLCLKKEQCNLQFEAPPPFGKYNGCKLTQGKCKEQGCQIVMPENDKEADGHLIIDAIEGKF
jgi:hypothetical protein